MIYRFLFFAVIVDGNSLRFKWRKSKAPTIKKSKIEGYKWQQALQADHDRRQAGFDARWKHVGSMPLSTYQSYQNLLPSQIFKKDVVLDAIVSIDPWDTPRPPSGPHAWPKPSDGTSTPNATSGGRFVPLGAGSPLDPSIQLMQSLLLTQTLFGTSYTSSGEPSGSSEGHTLPHETSSDGGSHGGYTDHTSDGYNSADSTGSTPDAGGSTDGGW